MWQTIFWRSYFDALGLRDSVYRRQSALTQDLIVR